MSKNKLALIALIGTSLMLVASTVLTYAWFDGSSNLAIENININFVGKEITASTDDVTFKEVLTNEDFVDVGVYKPVSSMFLNHWLSHKSEMPVYYDLGGEPYKTIVNDINDFKEADSGFLRQELFIKCTSDATIALDIDNFYAIGKDAENDEIANKIAAKFPEFTHEEIKANLNNVANSLRFSLLIEEDQRNDYAYYIIDPHKDSDTYLGGILDTDSDLYYDYVDDKEVLYGETSNTDHLAFSNEGRDSIEQSYSVFDANTKAGVSHLDIETSKQNGLVIAKENSLSLEEAKNITFEVASGVSKRIVLSIYLEGWDLDNTNLNMYAHFACGLSFKIADGTGGN